jgi:hypothetical protein
MPGWGCDTSSPGAARKTGRAASRLMHYDSPPFFTWRGAGEAGSWPVSPPGVYLATVLGTVEKSLVSD